MKNQSVTSQEAKSRSSSVKKRELKKLQAEQKKQKKRLGKSLNKIKEAEETEEDSVSKNLNLRADLENPEDLFSPNKATGFVGNLQIKGNQQNNLSRIDEDKDSDSQSSIGFDLENYNDMLIAQTVKKDAFFQSYFAEQHFSRLKYSDNGFQLSLERLDKEIETQHIIGEDERLYIENIA